MTQRHLWNKRNINSHLSYQSISDYYSMSWRTLSAYRISSPCAACHMCLSPSIHIVGFYAPQVQVPQHPELPVHCPLYGCMRLGMHALCWSLVPIVKHGFSLVLSSCDWATQAHTQHGGHPSCDPLKKSHCSASQGPSHTSPYIHVPQLHKSLY
jgi:hypothetical protein